MSPARLARLARSLVLAQAAGVALRLPIGRARRVALARALVERSFADLLNVKAARLVERFDTPRVGS